MDLRNLDAAYGRRSALRSAGVGLAALGALPLLTGDISAKQRGKNRKGSGKVKDRCLPQVAECEAVAETFCANVSDPARCRTALGVCCQPLGTCDGGQSIQCVIDAFTQKM